MKTLIQKICYAVTLMSILPLILLSSCGRKVTKKTWDEVNQELTVIRHGIPAYDKANIVYRCDGRAVLNVELQEPVVVALASKPEKWGYFQFPNIYRSAGGMLVATWNYAEDAASGYGKERPFMLSSDNGKTWTESNQPAPFGSGLLLPGSGDRINIRTPPALKVSELQLPQPIAMGGRRFSYYRLTEIPEALQGIYLNRWDKNGVWSDIHAGLEDPGALRHTDGKLFPVVWWGDMKLLLDNSIVAGIYPMWYERETGGVDPSGISFYRSTDDGMNWKIWGKIPYRFDLTVDPDGDKRLALGYTEPAFEILSDGTFLCVMRTDGPMYVSNSSNQGTNWSQPEPFTPNGVLPRLLQLDNGVLVLVSGRPGVQLRFSFDGKGEKWTDPFEMIPFNVVEEQSQRNWVLSHTCGYTELLATGPDSFLIIYSDFKHLNQNNEERKAILVREIKVTKK